MTHVTCRLTAKNRDQLRNPTLGNRIWATFTFYTLKELCNFHCTQRLTWVNEQWRIDALRVVDAKDVLNVQKVIANVNNNVYYIYGGYTVGS